jgi:hypothetical protein
MVDTTMDGLSCRLRSCASSRSSTRPTGSCPITSSRQSRLAIAAAAASTYPRVDRGTLNFRRKVDFLRTSSRCHRRSVWADHQRRPPAPGKNPAQTRP